MRNAEATRERILDAATAEFSAYGIAGARVDRIAKTAGCNKNLIYIYFENKETLFTTVLRKQLTRGYEQIVFTPDDLPGYAGRVFDLSMANPDFMRLMAWLSLEKKTEIPVERVVARDKKLPAILEAQEAGQIGAAFPPAFLLVAIMALATAWTPANPYGPVLDPESCDTPDSLRQRITEAVRLLTEVRQAVDGT